MSVICGLERVFVNADLSHIRLMIIAWLPKLCVCHEAAHHAELSCVLLPIDQADGIKGQLRKNWPKHRFYRMSHSVCSSGPAIQMQHTVGGDEHCPAFRRPDCGVAQQA